MFQIPLIFRKEKEFDLEKKSNNGVSHQSKGFNIKHDLEILEKLMHQLSSSQQFDTKDNTQMNYKCTFNNETNHEFIPLLSVNDVINSKENIHGSLKDSQL